MEIVFINQAQDRSVYRYKKDFLAIFECAKTVLNLEQDYVLSVIYVTPSQIHEINRDYRNIDRPTDVISFAMHDDESNIMLEEEVMELGDIFINVTAIADQASEYGHSKRREACFLFCHGLLHLLGYDHMTEEDEKEMFHLQDVILNEMVKR